MQLSDIGIYAYPEEPDLYVVTFDQDYRSDNFKAKRKKHQYWKKADGAWKILQEGSA